MKRAFENDENNDAGQLIAAIEPSAAFGWSLVGHRWASDGRPVGGN